METVNLNKIKSVDLNEIFGTPPEPKKEVLCKFIYYDEELTTLENSLTIVLDRDINRCIDNASEMSILLSVKYPERRVLLVNTYAGIKRMQESLVKGLVSAKVRLPEHWDGKQWEEINFSELNTVTLPQNLRLLNCPVATLTAERLAAEIVEHGYDIVILNSFEFSALSLYGRTLLARGLLKIRSERDLAMVLYSHEVRMNVSPSMIGRGPIGMMAPYSDAVWRVYMEYGDRCGYRVESRSS